MKKSNVFVLSMLMVTLAGSHIAQAITYTNRNDWETAAGIWVNVDESQIQIGDQSVDQFGNLLGDPYFHYGVDPISGVLHPAIMTLPDNNYVTFTLNSGDNGTAVPS